jgi:predicted nucleic acid-binding Zn ribbon protein
MKDLKHLSPEERGTYFLLQKEWERKEQNRIKVYLIILLVLAIIVMLYGN